MQAACNDNQSAAFGDEVLDPVALFAGEVIRVHVADHEQIVRE